MKDIINKYKEEKYMRSSLCKGFGTIILLLGSIGTLILAFKFGKTIDYSGVYNRNWTLTFTYFISGGLVTAIESTVLFALGKILEYFESMNFEKDNEIKNSVSLFNDENHHNKVASNISGNVDKWKCQECGRINPNYTVTCKCGEERKK